MVFRVLKTAWMPLCTLPYFNSMGLACARAQLVVVAAASTLAPAILAVVSRFGLLDATRGLSRRGWRKVSTAVVRWPVPIIVVTLVIAIIGFVSAAFIFPRVAVADPGFQPCAGCSSNDSTDDFPIPRRMISTTCDAEQLLAAARDFAPVYYQRYMIDYNNHPNVNHDAQNKAHWFYSLSPADRRAYSANFYAPQIDPLNLAWPNHMKIFFNNKGVVAKETENCQNYPRGDMSVWNWS